MATSKPSSVPEAGGGRQWHSQGSSHEEAGGERQWRSRGSSHEEASGQPQWRSPRPAHEQAGGEPQWRSPGPTHEQAGGEPQWRSPGPAHEQVAGHLRRAILAGELRPGERLPNEAELAASFNVSRTTIREALGTLVGERLIEKTRGLAGGSYVAQPSLDQLTDTLQIGVQLLGRSEGFSVEEFVEIRRMLEVPAARLAAERRTDEDIAHLATTIPPLSRAHPDSRSARGGEVRRHRADNWFHAAVVDTCRNRLLTLAIEPIFLVLQQQMNARSYGPAYHREIVKQHREIVDVIAAGDPQRSGELMRQHLEWLEPSYAKVWKAPFG